MKLWLLILLGFGVCETTVAQSLALSSPQAKADLVNNKTDLSSLVQTVLAGARTDDEKAKALFVWVAKHILYDEQKAARAPVNYGRRAIDTLGIAKQLMRTRKGICTDYSLLIYQLYRTAGLPVRIINGYAKGHFNQAGTPIQVVNHQWNVVWLDGRWQPLDATWASTNGGTRPLNLHYYLTPSEQFSADHFPHDAADQLINQPLTKAEFDSLPRIYASYFDLGFGPAFPRKGLHLIKRKLTLSVDNRAEMDFMVVANRYGNPDWKQTIYTRAVRNKKGYDLYMMLFHDGPFTVHVLSKTKDEDDYQLILTFTVISGFKPKV